MHVVKTSNDVLRDMCIAHGIKNITWLEALTGVRRETLCSWVVKKPKALEYLLAGVSINVCDHGILIQEICVLCDVENEVKFKGLVNVHK